MCRLHTYLLVERRAWLGAVTPNTPEGMNATPSGALAAAINAQINVERIMVPLSTTGYQYAWLVTALQRLTDEKNDLPKNSLQFFTNPSREYPSRCVIYFPAYEGRRVGIAARKTVVRNIPSLGASWKPWPAGTGFGKLPGRPLASAGAHV